MARRVVHDRVLLCRAVVPKRHAVWLPPEANLILRDLGLADQILQKLRAARRIVLAISTVRGRVEVGEVRRGGFYEQYFLAGFRVRATDRMLGIGKLCLQSEPLLDWHSGA